MTGSDEPDGSSSDGVPALREWAADQAWLADADRDRAEERVDRLAGDRDLAAALCAEGYRGRNYDLFANEIAKYGWAVIRGWIYKSQIRSEVKRKGFGALEAEPRIGSMIEDAESLADETVVLALSAFRDKVLVPGKVGPRQRCVPAHILCGPVPAAVQQRLQTLASRRAAFVCGAAGSAYGGLG
ncbi:hypothetical protein [Microbacterium sp. CH-015]|uniref:hypothetical protein n=1 Tax=Microbacterium sp. CH-015 TaxID=3406734 RepID=UPI003C71B68A